VSANLTDGHIAHDSEADRVKGAKVFNAIEHWTESDRSRRHVLSRGGRDVSPESRRGTGHHDGIVRLLRHRADDPGAVVVFVLERALGVALDVAQLWTFALGVSAVGIAGLALARGGVIRGLFAYAMVSALAAFIVMSAYGVRAAWPHDLWRFYVCPSRELDVMR
jgi:hypothetical protein